MRAKWRSFVPRIQKQLWNWETNETNSIWHRWKKKIQSKFFCFVLKFTYLEQKEFTCMLIALTLRISKIRKIYLWSTLAKASTGPIPSRNCLMVNLALTSVADVWRTRTVMFKEAPQTVGRTLVKSIICEDLKESIKINYKVRATYSHIIDIGVLVKSYLYLG